MLVELSVEMLSDCGVDLGHGLVERRQDGAVEEACVDAFGIQFRKCPKNSIDERVFFR